jgi:lysophospholipid acyltransferase
MSLFVAIDVYARLAPFGRSIATIGTYSVSAFWHGFYPGYYIFFVLSAFQTLAAQGTQRLQ